MGGGVPPIGRHAPEILGIESQQWLQLIEFFVWIALDQEQERKYVFRYSASSQNVIFIHCFVPLLHLKYLFTDLYVSMPYI